VRQSDTFGVGCGNACAQFLAATKLINPDATHPCAIVAGSYAHWWVGMNMPNVLNVLPGSFRTLYCSNRCTGNMCGAPDLDLEQIQVVDGVTLYKFRYTLSTRYQSDHHNGCYQVRPCGTPDPSVEHEPLSFT
jgi:hypothetical protein